MSELDKKRIEAYQEFVEFFIEMWGVKHTISRLLDLGFTREDLISDKWDVEDIDYVIAHPDEDYF